MKHAFPARSAGCCPENEDCVLVRLVNLQDRLKAYGKKVRKLESAEYLATHKPATEVNIAAANRFINHAIPDLSQDQKAALKQASSLQESSRS